MKKPQKPAPKAAKKSAPAKKPVAKSAAKPAAKPAAKAAAKKPVAKVAAKKPAAKVVAKKPVAKAAAKVVAKKPAAKPVVKTSAKPAPKATAKVAPKVATPVKGKTVEVKPAKAAAIPAKKELEKKVVAPKKEEKKLSKKEEKELLKKGKGKKAETFEEELLEELEAKSREDEDDFDDFETAAPTKVKMTFDEVIDEEELPVRKKKAGADDDIKENLAEEILAMSEDFKIEDIFSSIRNMDLFKIESDECVVRGCDNPSTTNGYCRYHYIKFWKDVKKKELILTEGRLAKIIEELVRKYPVKYIETIIQDLADDKAFNHVLKDLDIETDAEDLDTFEDDELLDDDQDIAFETKVVKPSFDD